MSGFDSSQAIRYSIDAASIGPCLVGLRPYQVNLVTVTGAQRSVGQTGGLGTKTYRRITVAAMFDGYSTFAPGDGYLNPHAYDVKGKTPIQAGQALTEMEWMLGPLTFPYVQSGTIGGTDANLFFPTTPNTNIYVQILGPGLNTVNGQYFKVQEVVLSESDNLSYSLRLISTNEVA